MDPRQSRAVTRLGSVMRLPRSGGTPELVASEQAGAHSVIDDAGTLYWTAETGAAVVRKRPEQDPVLIASGQPELKNLVVDSAYVYWTTRAGNVMRARK